MNEADGLTPINERKEGWAHQTPAQAGSDSIAQPMAGGEKDIAVYLIAKENAVEFYEKLGMKKAEDVMQYNKIEWTEFTVSDIT